MASAAQTFSQAWSVGRRVRETAAPHRKGTISARQGTGTNARITVNLDGRPPQAFFPAQLTLL